MGVQGEYGNARTVDVEVHFQRTVEDGELLLNQLLRQGGGDVLHGDVSGDERHAEVVLHENHQCLVPLARTFLDVLRMSGEMKGLRLDGRLVDGSRDQYVDQSGTVLCQGTFQCIQGGTSGLLRRLGKLHLHFVVGAVDHAELPVGGFRGRVDDAEVRLQLHGFAVIGRHLG